MVLSGKNIPEKSRLYECFDKTYLWVVKKIYLNVHFFICSNFISCLLGDNCIEFFLENILLLFYKFAPNSLASVSLAGVLFVV